MKKVFIDGSAGTTGLRIRERLSGRGEITLITLPEALRKDPAARKDAMNQADIVFLCLPDGAALEAAQWIENPNTAVIDTSTAHRTAEGWVYGLPELTGQEQIAGARRIANPGCHASGFIALVAPLVRQGVISPDALLSCFCVTGYSGGGNKMIAEYEAQGRDPLLDAPRQYALGQGHKHLKEMKKLTGLANPPVFSPIVADFYSGMEMTVPLFAQTLRAGAEEIRDIYRSTYTGKLIHFDEDPAEGGFLSAAAFSGRDDMQLTVTGNDERLLLVARYDNLGKGASGAAIQNMNLLLGLSPTEGLIY